MTTLYAIITIQRTKIKKVMGTIILYGSSLFGVLYAFFNIIALELAYCDHKRKLKTNPNYEKDLKEKQWKKELDRRIYYGGYASESNSKKEDSSSWDNNNINLMQI